MNRGPANRRALGFLGRMGCGRPGPFKLDVAIYTQGQNGEVAVGGEAIVLVLQSFFAVSLSV